MLRGCSERAEGRSGAKVCRRHRQRVCVLTHPIKFRGTVFPELVVSLKVRRRTHRLLPTLAQISLRKSSALPLEVSDDKRHRTLHILLILFAVDLRIAKRSVVKEGQLSDPDRM